MTIFESTNDTCTTCGHPQSSHEYVQHTLGACTTFAPAPQADVRVIAGVTVDVLLDQCERLAEPIRASTKSFQYASALDNCVAVIKALRGAVPETKECSACGGTGRMGPFFPGGLSTICGNCQTPSPETRVDIPSS